MKIWTLKKIASLKAFFTSLIQNADNNNLKKYLLITALLGACNLAYSLFSIYTLLSFGILSLSILCYVKVNLDKIKTNGLITYLPSKLQKVLLQRSLFDLICDIWFIPRLSIFLKAFLLPFFVKIEPADAINQLEELSLGTRKLILTKGVLNIMPNSMKSIMLPNNEKVSEETLSSAESNEHEEEKEPAEKNVVGKAVNRVDSKKSLTEMLFNDSSHSQKTSSLILESLGNESTVNNKGGINSTDEENLVNHNFSLSKQMELKKSLPSFSDMTPLRAHLDYPGRPHKPIQHFKQQNQANRGVRSREKNEEGRKVRRSLVKEPEEGLRSQILNSSRLENKKGVSGNKLEFSETWDRLEMFAKKHREKLLRQKSEGNAKKPQMKGIFQTLHNIATLLSKDAIMEKIEDVNLFKIFLLSSVALLVHFSISKKAKYWFYYTLQILMYVIGIVLSTGSMAIYTVKMRARYLQWKEQQKQQETNAGGEKEEETE